MTAASVFTSKQLLARSDAAATIARLAASSPVGSLPVELLALAVLRARAAAERLATGASA